MVWNALQDVVGGVIVAVLADGGIIVRHFLFGPSPPPHTHKHMADVSDVLENMLEVTWR